MIKLLLLLFKSKFLLSAGTMLLSIALYAWQFGWPFAVGFVLLMLVHELGHFVAARQRGLDVGLPTFIPFVGAWVELKDMPHNVATEAYVAVAGPIAGTLASMALFWASESTGSHLLLALAYSGFFINLINLIPMMPFDGGRVVAIVSPKIWLVGLPIALAVWLWRPSPLLLIIMLLALPSLWQAWRSFRGHPDAVPDHLPADYYNAPAELRLKYGALYIGLVVFLAVMCYELHESLTHLR